ncbi:hypothetical protein GOEFS_063_00140 [Gordonia effusa NBRC 100432]|uniref:Uncharacterized protein n=1 Tax=Gordonia effusa NBRC 100432 TaxID=1077974 RepID=H0R0Y9_9ACTN|nr:hypothetical protein [Gordonia effusa]GAB18740.1 hypothetical protein GOEFS_063_00140 [Gordonia effusa NBRC 100432]
MSSGRPGASFWSRLAVIVAAAGTLALALVGVGYATAAMSAPTSRYGTDCVYRLSLPVPSHDVVTFVESDLDGGRPVTITNPVVPRGGLASARWRPTIHGERVLIAEQDGVRSVAVPVAVLAGGGPLCR